MKLKDYIQERQLDVNLVAQELEISRGYLYELLAERMTPGRKTALRIIKWSDGMVKFKDLWGSEAVNQ